MSVYESIPQPDVKVGPDASLHQVYPDHALRMQVLSMMALAYMGRHDNCGLSLQKVGPESLSRFDPTSEKYDASLGWSGRLA
jgi:hypothetical protein